MERVLWPMEPVEPRMANFFTEAIFADSKLEARGGTPFLRVCEEVWTFSRPSFVFEGRRGHCGALTTT